MPQPLTGFRRILVLCSLAALPGCSVWQTSALTAGLGQSSEERQIIKQADSDPFPSPAQVGLDTSS